MTLPFRPPPKSLDGRSARELFAYERTVDNGDPVPPPASLARVPDTDITVMASGDQLALLAQPAALMDYYPTQREWVDASGRTHVRLLTDVIEAGAAGARHVLKFIADDDADPGNPANYTDAGALGTEVPVSLAETGPQRSSSWLPLHASARQDRRWKVWALGGDGVLTPVVSNVHYQFRTALELPMEKWYWRNLVPGAAPEPMDPDLDALGPLSSVEDQTAYTGLQLAPSLTQTIICNPPLSTFRYTNLTPTSVQTGVKVLRREKAPNDLGATGFVPFGDAGHWNFSGPIGRLIGPPLASQLVPGFAYEHWYSAVEPSAFCDGTPGCRMWVWRPGVGRVVLGVRSYFVDGVEVFEVQAAESKADGKYVRYIPRQVHNFGLFPGFQAEDGDRFVVDVYSGSWCDCGAGATNQGLGCWVSYNGTIEPTDPEGLADGWTGTAAYTALPRLRYLGDI